MSERVAAIDVGTNSVLLLVAERRGSSFAAVDERMEITRLGRGVDRTRRLDHDAMDETVKAVADFAAAARDAGASRLVVTATSAARDADNGAEFLSRARAAAGVQVEILSGADEADLSYASARADFGAPLTVIDVGGGSTEIVHGSEAGVVFARSIDVGAVRLTERHLHADPPRAAELAALRADLARELAAVPPALPGARMVAVAGTATTLAAISLGLDTYDGSLVHGARMPLATLRELAARLASLPLDERRRISGLPPRRADVIVAGAEILAAVLEHLEAGEVTVSDRGVRWGLLARRFGAG